MPSCRIVILSQVFRTTPVFCCYQLLLFTLWNRTLKAYHDIMFLLLPVSILHCIIALCGSQLVLSFAIVNECVLLKLQKLILTISTSHCILLMFYAMNCISSAPTALVHYPEMV